MPSVSNCNAQNKPSSLKLSLVRLATAIRKVVSAQTKGQSQARVPLEAGLQCGLEDLETMSYCGLVPHCVQGSMMFMFWSKCFPGRNGVSGISNLAYAGKEGKQLPQTISL